MHSTTVNAGFMQTYSCPVVDERTPILDGYITGHRKGFRRHLIIHHDCELVTDFTRGTDMVRKMSTEEAEAKKKAIRARRSSAARRETSGTTREQPCHDRPGVPDTAVATVGALTEADDASLSRAGINLPPSVDLRKSAEREPEDSDWEFERLEEHPAWALLLELAASSSSPPAEPEVAIGQSRSLETASPSSGDAAAGNGQVHCLPPPEDERAMVFGDITFDEIVASASPLAAFPPAAASVETFLLSTPPTVVGVASPASATSSAADVEKTVTIPVTARPTSIDDLAIAIFDESDRDPSLSDEQVFKRVAARFPNRPATDDRRIADLCRAEVLWDRLKFQRGLHAVNSLPESAPASTVRRTLTDVLTPRAARPIVRFYGSRSHPYRRRLH
jgi:hypothetical protein